MEFLTLKKAADEVAALNARIEASKAPNSEITFEENRANFEAELRDIFERTSVGQFVESQPDIIGPQPGVTALYSGRLESPDSPNRGQSLAQQAAMDYPGEVGIIENTHAGQLAESSEVKLALTNLFGDPRSTEASAFMYNSRGFDGAPGVFDGLSERFAAQTTGDVITFSPNANPLAILSATEIPAPSLCNL